MSRLPLLACLRLAPGLHAAAPAIPINYDEAKVPPYTLPDPLVAADGTPVRDAADWRARRRPELLELFAREVHGRTPGGRPSGMRWEVTGVDRAALGGKAVRKEVTLWFTDRRDGPRMHLLLYLPAGARGPVPAFLGYNYYGNQGYGHSYQPGGYDNPFRGGSDYVPAQSGRSFPSAAQESRLHEIRR